MALDPATGMIIGAGIGLGDTLIRSYKANKLIKSMQGKMPQYRTVQDIQREAQGTIKSGLTTEEMAQARGDIARQASAGYRVATQTNPNLAGAIQAGINYGTIGQYGQLAAQSARLREQKIQSLASMLTQADARKTGEERQLYMEAMRGAGLAKQQAAQQRIETIQSGIYGLSQLESKPKPPSPTDPGYFSGFNKQGQEVSINPDFLGAYQEGYRPE